MNDIEILEKLKVTLTMHHLGGAEAIENLIQRNKDLEQIEQEHKEENGRLRNELEKLSKLLYLCTPEIPQCQHGKYISYVDLVRKLEKKDKTIEDIKFINNNNKPHIAQQKIREYFTNKVEEDK